MKMKFVTLGLALAFSQVAVAGQMAFAEKDAVSVTAAVEALDEIELTAAFGAGEMKEIAALSDEEMMETTGAKAKKSSIKKGNSQAKNVLNVTKAVVKANLGNANSADYALINKHDKTLAKIQKGAKVVAIGSAVVGTAVAAVAVAGTAAAASAAATVKLKAIEVAIAAAKNPELTKRVIAGSSALAAVGKSAVDQYKASGHVDIVILNQKLIHAIPKMLGGK